MITYKKKIHRNSRASGYFDWSNVSHIVHRLLRTKTLLASLLVRSDRKITRVTAAYVFY